MNENINLIEILKDCPNGTKLYSPLFGEVEFVKIDNDSDIYPIVINATGDYYVFTQQGKFNYKKQGECVLFPSKGQRDWSKFKPKKPKFDPKTLQPFDKVLARVDGGNAYCWFADFVSIPAVEKYDMTSCIMSNEDAKMIIPYNEETKHLVGTDNEAPEYYRYWED